MEYLTLKAKRLLYLPRSVTSQKPYMVLTLRLCVAYGSQHKERLVVYTALTEWFCITEVESVYCAVRTESLYKGEKFSSLMRQNSPPPPPPQPLIVLLQE